MGNFFSSSSKPQPQPQPQPQTPIGYYETINELKKQNESLKQINETLRKNINIVNAKLHSEIAKNNNSESESIDTILDSLKRGINNRDVSNNGGTKISMPAIEEYVDKMISDPDVNINYLPDFVEKQLYRNILKIVLGLLDHILNNSHLMVFNHEIKLDLLPIPDYSNEVNNGELQDNLQDKDINNEV